jgi:predicted transposase YbfD/YdcC
MNPPIHAQNTTFYTILQNAEGLDTRDNRGKRHEIAGILTGLCIGLLSNRDGNLSSMHRHMVNHYPVLKSELGLKAPNPVSRAQLPLILSGINLPIFEQLMFSFCKIELSSDEKRWFSGDGKELRGSILKGDKRGEAVVQVVEQQSGKVLSQSYYNGTKESEIPCMRDLLSKCGVLDQKITMDALHFNPEMLNAIHSAKGIYLIGLKENQMELFQEMSWLKRGGKPGFVLETKDKGHGRFDKRRYQSFDIGGVYVDKRWCKSGLKTLICVERERTIRKTGEISKECALFLTNDTISSQEQADDVFSAVRGHWAVETTNHVRDVSLKEDNLRTKKTMCLRGWPLFDL